MARLISLRQLKGELKALGDDLVRMTDDELAKGLRDRYAVRARRLSPRASGKLASSWTKSEKPGRYMVTSKVDHSVVMDRGRKIGAGGRMMGSKQAPRGIIGPTQKEIERRAEADIDRTVGRLFK